MYSFSFSHLFTLIGVITVVHCEGGCDRANETRAINSTIEVCIPFTNETASNLMIHTSCLDFLENRCSLFNQTNFDQIHSAIDSIVKLLISPTGQENNIEQENWCGYMLLGIACNSAYLGCNPATGLPIRLCKSSCLEYSTLDYCLPVLTELLLKSAENESVIDIDINLINCNNTFDGDNDDEGEDGLVGVGEENQTQHDCYRAIVGVGEVPEGTNEPTTSLTEITNENEETAGMTNLFLTYILPSISAMVGCAMLVVVILSGCYIRRLKRRSSCVGVTMGGDPYSSTNAFPQLLSVKEIYSNRYTFHHLMSEDGSRVVERSILPVSNSTATSSGASNVTENSAVFQLDLTDWAAVGEGVLIPFDRVIITGHLGEGAFGYVVKGLLKDIHTSGREYHIPVAMKTLKNCASYDEMRGLLLESSLMHSFSHPNILSLRGLCLNPKSGAPYLVMPYMENGDLRKFLRQKAELTDGGSSVTTYPPDLTHDLLARMCGDVARGMEYLAEKRLVHRDLAARNCMVDRSLRVKVADFGLTREIYEQDYYRQSSNGQLPIKWMSPESLAYRMSNEKTDVWSFGVICWEVFSLGKVPYPTIDNRDLLDYLDCGRRLSKPRLCNQHVYDVMQLCWKMKPDERPCFSEIVTHLKNPNTPSSSLSFNDAVYHQQTSQASESFAKSKTSSIALKRKTSDTVALIEGDAAEAKEVIVGDEEYVEMYGKDNGDEESIIFTNGSSFVVTPSSSPKSISLLISDTSSITFDANTLSLTLDDEALVLGNTSSAAPPPPLPPSSSSHPESSLQDAIPPRRKKRSLTIASRESLPIVSEEKEEKDEKGEKEESFSTTETDLLDSILTYFQEKSTDSSEKSEKSTQPRHGDGDADFVAVQMKEIETTYRSGSIASSSSSSSLMMTSTLRRDHTHSLRAVQQQSTSDNNSEPNMESPSEKRLLSSPYEKVIYDECPSSPNVVISFNSGEKVRPADRLFNFSRNRSQTAREISIQGREGRGGGRGGGEVGSKSAATSAAVTKRGREEEGRGSVVSLPIERCEEVEGGGWKMKVRDRFFSYSAGDYVKMHPAPRQQ